MYSAARGLGALWAKGVTGGCEGGLLSTQDDSCCSEADFTDITYRTVLGLWSWMMLNEVRTWNILTSLVQTPAGRGFKTGVQALAYDQGWNEDDPKVAVLAAKVIAAFDGFARLFPVRRLAVIGNVDNVGAKNCGPYPQWGQRLTPALATFDVNARAKLVAAVPTVPKSYLDAMAKTGVLEYLWHYPEAWANTLTAPNVQGMPAPPLPVMQWLRRALTVINSNPFTFTGAGFTEGQGLVGYRTQVMPADLITFGSGGVVTVRPWLSELFNVFPPSAEGAMATDALKQAVAYANEQLAKRTPLTAVALQTSASSPTNMSTMTISGSTAMSPWVIAALVAVPIVVGGAVWFKHHRAGA